MQTSVSSNFKRHESLFEAVDEQIDLEQQAEPLANNQSLRKSIIPVVLLSAALFIIHHLTQLNKYHLASPPTKESFIQIHAKKEANLFASEAVQVTESLSIFLVSSFAITFDLLGGMGGPVIFQIGYWILCDWQFIATPNLRVSVLLAYVAFIVPYLIRIWRLSNFVDRMFTPIFFGTALAGGILGSLILVIMYDLIWVVRSMGFLFLVTLLFNLIHARSRAMESDSAKRADNEMDFMGADVFDSSVFQFSQYWLTVAGLIQGTLNGMYAAGGPVVDVYSAQFRTPSKLRSVSMLIGFSLGNGLASIIMNGFAMGGFQNRDLHMYLSAFFGGLLAVLLSLSCEGVVSQDRFDNGYRVFLGAGAVLMLSLGTTAGRVIGYVIGAAYFGIELLFFTFIIVMSTFWRNQDERWYYENDRPQ